MKRHLSFFLASAALLLAVSSCEKPAEIVGAPYLKIDKPVLTFIGTDAEPQTVVASMVDAPQRNTLWESDNEEVATVTDGVVTPVAMGEAYITAATGDGKYRTACLVAVIDDFMGEASFRTSRTWTVGGQTWSDAVMATRCRKTEYDGGAYDQRDYKVDCRENGKYGDLFSWRAVREYRTQLCPYPWRVPTALDFKTLDIALGGTGLGDEAPFNKRIARYIMEWGGEYGGYCWVDPTSGTNKMVIWYQGLYAGYWSYEQYSITQGIGMNYGTDHQTISPLSRSEKTNGYNLRCVK